jgi:hypothetical protein
MFYAFNNFLSLSPPISVAPTKYHSSSSIPSSISRQEKSRRLGSNPRTHSSRVRESTSSTSFVYIVIQSLLYRGPTAWGITISIKKGSLLPLFVLGNISSETKNLGKRLGGYVFALSLSRIFAGTASWRWGGRYRIGRESHSFEQHCSTVRRVSCILL